jgi:hypothetical protein
MPFGHSRFDKCDPTGSLNNYSCSPPGVEVGSAPSVRLFLCEPFLPDGLAPVSGKDAELVELVAFSALLDFFEFFELGAPPLLSAGDAPAVAPAALLGDALALAPGEPVAAALGEAAADGDVVA